MDATQKCKFFQRNVLPSSGLWTSYGEYFNAMIKKQSILGLGKCLGIFFCLIIFLALLVSAGMFVSSL